MAFKSKTILTVIFLVVILVLFFSDAYPLQANNLLFVGDFERGDLTGFFWNQNKPEVVTAPHPVRAGKYSMRSYLHRYDSKYSYRTMAQVGSKDTNPENLRKSFSMAIGKEYWVGFSIFVPNGFTPDGDGCGELWFQFQAVPDPGELWRSPLTALVVIEDQWVVGSRWDTKAFSPDMRFERGEDLAVLPLSPDRGKWVDWVFHVKWSWHDDGLLEIWKDGDLVGARQGPNCSNDHEGPRMSFGVYKWPWKEGKPAMKHCSSSVTERLIYVDEFRVGNEKASYNDVAPGGKPPSPQPSPTSTPTLKPSFFLNSGWNQITWPEISNYNAKTALEDIENDCGAGTAVAIAKKGRSRWENYVKDYGGKNFNLQNNQNYYINANKNCAWYP